MPLYEYICDDCQMRFEALRAFSRADDLLPCPRCQSKRTKRAISRFAAFTKTGGETTGRPLGGNPCAACSSGSCATCS